MRDNHTDIERQRQIYRPTDTDTYTLREDINKDRSRGRETDRYNWTYTERDKQRQGGVTCFHRAGFAYGAMEHGMPLYPPEIDACPPPEAANSSAHSRHAQFGTISRKWVAICRRIVIFLFHFRETNGCIGEQLELQAILLFGRPLQIKTPAPTLYHCKSPQALHGQDL